MLKTRNVFLGFQQIKWTRRPCYRKRHNYEKLQWCPVISTMLNQSHSLAEWDKRTFKFGFLAATYLVPDKKVCAKAGWPGVVIIWLRRILWASIWHSGVTALSKSPQCDKQTHNTYRHCWKGPQIPFLQHLDTSVILLSELYNHSTFVFLLRYLFLHITALQVDILDLSLNSLNLHSMNSGTAGKLNCLE